MTRARFGILTLLLLAASQTAFGQTRIPLREGSWELTVQVDMPGMPMKMPDIKNTLCLGKDQLEDPSRAVPSPSPGASNDCKVSEYEMKGSRATWKIACTQPVPVGGSGEIAYGDDAYSGSMTVTIAGSSDATLKFSGKRLGDCTPATK